MIEKQTPKKTHYCLSKCVSRIPLRSASDCGHAQCSQNSTTVQNEPAVLLVFLYQNLQSLELLTSSLPPYFGEKKMLPFLSMERLRALP